MTYKMEYVCSNCGTKKYQEVQTGKPALYQGGECPYCGTRDSVQNPFTYRKPYYCVDNYYLKNG